jgi:hypothetical protein
MRARNGFEIANADKLALEGGVVRKSGPVDDFHRAIGAENISGQPDGPVSPFANAPHHRVIGD